MDIDGVLYKWDETARHLLRDAFGYVLPESSSWDYLKENISPEAWSWLWNEGVRQGLFRHGSLYEGAADAMKRLCAGHDVAVVTSRPRVAANDTLAWLAYHRWSPTEVHVVPPGQSKTLVGYCDVWVEDRLDNAVELSVEYPESRVLLWDRPWNQDDNIVYTDRVTSWDGVIEAVALRARVKRDLGHTASLLRRLP